MLSVRMQTTRCFSAAGVAGFHFCLFTVAQAKRSQGPGTLGRRLFARRILTAMACESKSSSWRGASFRRIVGIVIWRRSCAPNRLLWMQHQWARTWRPLLHMEARRGAAANDGIIAPWLSVIHNIRRWMPNRHHRCWLRRHPRVFVLADSIAGYHDCSNSLANRNPVGNTNADVAHNDGHRLCHERLE